MDNVKDASSSFKTESPKQKKSILKRFFKIIFYFILVLISINILLIIALSTPYIQQKVLAVAVNKVKEITKTDVQIERIDLHLFNKVSLTGIYIDDLNKDTLVYAKELKVGISPLKLLKGRLQIDEIHLSDFTLNVSQETPDSDFNFQFLIDAFTSDTPSTDDSTSSSLQIAIEDIILKNGRICYNVFSEPETPKLFNASHIVLDNLQSTIHLPSIDLSKLDVKLASLSFVEQSGFRVNHLNGKVTSDQFKLFIQDLALTLPHSSIQIPNITYNLLNSEFKISAAEGILSSQDLLVFMPDLKYLTENIGIKTSIEGKLPSINISDFILNYGNQSQLNAKASISDYANYDKADINLEITDFRISPKAVTDFILIGDSTFILPDIVQLMGDIRLSGSLEGKLSDFTIDTEAWFKQGAIQLVADGAMDTTFQNFNVNARLQTQNFKLGDLLEYPELRKLSMNLTLHASQSPQKAFGLDAKGIVREIQYTNETLRDIPFTAFYNATQMGAWLKASLPQGKIDLKADMTQTKIPKTTVDLKVDNLQLDKFADFPDWKKPELSFELDADLLGLDVNTMQGAFILKDLNFSHDSITFQPGTISLELKNNENKENQIKLGSSFFDAQIDGKYDLIRLYEEFNNLMSNYLPGIFPKPKGRMSPKTDNDFQLEALIHNTEDLEKTFDLPFKITKPITLNGQFNSRDNKLNAVGKIDDIKFGDNSITNTILKLAGNDSILSINLNSELLAGENKLNISYNADALADSISNYLNIKDDSDEFDLNLTLKALAHFEYDKNDSLLSYIQFKPTDIQIGKLDLHFMPAQILNYNDKTSISNFGFTVGKGRSFSKFLGIDGVISNNPQDTLKLNFTNAEVGDLLQAFNIENISTTINGDIKLVNILKTPEMYTNNFHLDDIILFKDTIGELKVYSKWNDAEGAIGFYSTLGRDSILSKTSGWVYPAKDSLNLKINLDRLSINWVEPFMVGLLNRVSGTISSGLTATGRLSAPTIQGWLGVNDTYLGIDYTNVTYHIWDTIPVTPDKIGFDNLVIADNYNNKARVNAIVTHKDFQDINYNIDVTMQNFLVLNTMNRVDSLFYGKLFVSGTANLKGNEESMNIKMNISNGKNSLINVQIPQTLEATDYSSIVYINTPIEDSTSNILPTDVPEVFPLKLAVDLNVNKDIGLSVILNPITGDKMEINGAGLIKFNYDMQSEAMSAFGNYVISSGDVKLKLQNIATIVFQIEDGSKLILNGDPMKTDFNITAYKRVRADLLTLDPSFEASGSTKVLVDCVLGITGNMNKMNLTYSIRLPNAPEDIQEKVKSLVSTDEQRTRQFAYLLVTGAFYSNSGGTGGNIADGLLTSIASSALSSGLNALFGNMLGNKWQIGTNISSNDGTFSDMDMSVSVSRSFMDDRLTFNTNLGYRTDQSLATENSFIGDFDVEYALTRAIKLKVFNRTNDQFYKQSPTTQGVGIVYTKEAKRIKDLFRILRKKRKARKATQEQTNSTK